MVWVPTTEGFEWPADLPPTWNGLSVGHWEGDTLVIETDRFNGYTKLDTSGHPHSSGVKFVNVSVFGRKQIVDVLHAAVSSAR